MIGWRGKIGLVAPTVFGSFSEHTPLLPDGVAMFLYTLDLRRLVPEEFERIYNMFLPAARRLAEEEECDVVIIGGGPILTHMGYDRSREMTREITGTTGVTTISHLEGLFDALNLLSTKKLVIVTPFEDEINEGYSRLCKALGFDVVNTKGLGLQQAGSWGKLAPDTAYRLAKQAFLETPECDAIWINCPVWETTRYVAKLEYDTGKPVITTPIAIVWTALRAMQIKEPVKGYGRLMELL